ncbi:MAG: hypothetical protein J7604_05225 [Sporocytophaga sp.]|uniref:hypothetical protein n=1 Tax=Sporocytophaga sp. TaxID=2231183 RepID=UPI001B18A423|nr:hypothetical protein [Sporocytophaga sp.]MBO9699590.1 hypothetical protein [Sporocytophaga sp.]
MLTFLIPTDFSEETFITIKNLKALVNSSSLKIILLYSVPLPNSIIETLFLPKYKDYPRSDFQEELDKIKAEAIDTDMHIHIHCQYGISEPILDHIICEYGIHFSVISDIQPKKEQEELFDIIKKSYAPVLHIPQGCRIDANPSVGIIMPKGYKTIPSDLQNLLPLQRLCIYNESDSLVNINDKSVSISKAASLLKELQINLLIEMNAKRKKSLLKKRTSAHSKFEIGIPLLRVNYN